MSAVMVREDTNHGFTIWNMNEMLLTTKKKSPMYPGNVYFCIDILEATIVSILPTGCAAGVNKSWHGFERIHYKIKILRFEKQ